MKFVGKTSVAVIKSAILGGLRKWAFFFFSSGEGKREEEKKKIPVYRWDAYIRPIAAKTIGAPLINDISVAGSAKSKKRGLLGYCPSLSPTRQ